MGYRTLTLGQMADLRDRERSAAAVDQAHADERLADEMLHGGLGLAALGGLTERDAIAANGYAFQVLDTLQRTIVEHDGQGHIDNWEAVLEATAAVLLQSVQTMRRGAKPMIGTHYLTGDQEE